MNQQTAIRQGITIDRVCPGISQAARVHVAEILACSNPNPDALRRHRLEKLEATPAEQREQIRAWVNQVIKART